jgi:hypothetical protein
MAQSQVVFGGRDNQAKVCAACSRFASREAVTHHAKRDYRRDIAPVSAPKSIPRTAAGRGR